MSDFVKNANEINSLNTETGKVFELDPALKLGSFGFVGTTGPIHYKETYADHEPWQDIDETYCEWSEMDGVGKVLIYSKMPNMVTVFQDICGYEIRSRNNPDHIARVELVGIDGTKTNKWMDNENLNFFSKVHPYRVGIWKEFKKSRSVSSSLRWKITEKGTSKKDSHPFFFREKPEAFSAVGLTDLSPAAMEAAKTGIETARTRIDDISWHWDEIIPANAMLVDTDWQVASDPDDLVLYYPGSPTAWHLYTGDGIWVGYASTFYAKAGNALRFQNVNVPGGSTINTATLSVRCNSSLSGTTVKSRILGHKNANPSAISSLEDFQSRRGTVIGGADNTNITTAQVAWDSISAWTSGTWYNSVDCSSVSQELINLVGWASGNSMLFFWDDFEDRSSHSANAYRQGSSYAGGSSYAPKLSMTWTEPPTGWSKKVIGVSSPSKIYSIPKANIVKVLGVS